MTWSIEFLSEAEKDMKKLDHSVQIQVLKGIRKVSQNPLPTEEGGYGKPLGNKNGVNLTSMMDKHVTEEDVERFIEQVDNIADLYLGRNRFISYREAGGFISELEDILDGDV